MEKAQAILTRLNWALRLRRALLTLSISLFGLALILHALRFFGISFSPKFFVGCIALAFLTLIFPLPRFQRRLFWAGRRLGLGGKLAGLSAALAQTNHTFLSALLEDLAFPIRRLFFPEVFALFPAFFLSFLLLFPFPPELLPKSEPALEATEAAETIFSKAPAEQAKETEHQRIEQEIPKFPPGFFEFSPYPLVLTALYGEELSLEEAVRKLAQEEGVLRRLAELLAKAAAGEITKEISAEMAELISSLGRPDLKEALSQVLKPENEDVAKAQALVEAALAGISQAQEQLSALEAEGGVPQAGQDTGGSLESAQNLRALHPEILLEDEAQETQAQPRRELVEAQEGLGAGWEQGEPLTPGIPEEKKISAEGVAASVRPGEGPLRAGIALSIPGETPETLTETTVELSPTELELILREGSLPPALRELVRRYFELIARGGE